MDSSGDEDSDRRNDIEMRKEEWASVWEKCAPMSPKNIVMCPNGCEAIPKYHMCIDLYGSYKLFCVECEKKWYTCSKCGRLRNHVLYKSIMKRHACVKNAVSCLGEGSLEDVDDDADGVLLSALGDLRVTSPKFQEAFDRRANQRYFRAEYRSLGSEFLVTMCHFHSDALKDRADRNEVELQCRLAEISILSSTKENDRLAHLLDTLCKLYVDGNKDSVPTYEIPRSIEECRKLYREGQYSISNLLPHPTVENVGGHAYVSIREVIAHMAGVGVPIMCLPPIKKYPGYYENDYIKCISQSPYCKRIATALDRTKSEEGSWDLPVYIWSDGATFRMTSKGQRNNGWMMSVTALAPWGLRNNRVNTEIIALGKSKDDHTPVEERVRQELLEMNKNGGTSMFWKDLKGSVKVTVHLLIRLGDAKERAPVLRVTEGSGLLNARWGFLLNAWAVWDKLVPCASCLDSMLLSKKNWNRFGCTQCSNWSYEGEGIHLLMIDPPKDYPADGTGLIDGKIPPRKHTLASMVEAKQLTHQNIVKGKWSIPEGLEYLKHYGVQPSLRNLILERADNCYLWEQRHNTNEVWAEQMAWIKNDFEKNPEHYTEYPTPPTWLPPYKFEQFVDAPMHHLTGVVEGMHKVVMSWCTQVRNKTSLVSILEEMLAPIQDMKIEWGKIMYNFGGMVSENWRDYGRLLRWCFSVVPHIDEGPPYQDPTSPQKIWTMKQNRKWLRKRLITIPSDANAASLREFVAEYMARPEGPPPINEHPGAPVECVEKMIMAFSCFLARAFSVSVNNEMSLSTDRHARMFLAYLEQVDAASREKGTKSVVIRQYNNINCLNIGNTQRDKGSLRNFWDGGYNGEGMVRVIKDQIGRVSGNWHSSALKRIYKQNAISRLVSTFDTEREGGEEYTRQDFFMYETLLQLNSTYERGRPISGVLDTNKKVHIFLENTSSFVLVKEDYVATVWGLSYFKWQKPSRKRKKESEEMTPLDTCILLPMHQIVADNLDISLVGVYALITSEWEELLRDGSLGPPEFDGANYGEADNEMTL